MGQFMSELLIMKQNKKDEEFGAWCCVLREK
jgi:hypothetical protein